MEVSLIDKLTNFLMPEEEATAATNPGRKVQLRVYSEASLSVLVFIPANFDDVEEYAEALKKGRSVILNLETVDIVGRRRIFDYLNGVSYVIGVQVEKVSEHLLMYTPAHVELKRELYAYSIPTYIKQG